jgi:predicted Zn-dependent peptidase
VKKFIFILILVQEVLMSAVIDYINVKNTNIPFIYEKDNLERVNLQIVFKNSGNLANDKIAGLAKFSASLLNEGTKELGAIKFADQLESKAIEIHSTVGNETFVISISCLSEQLDYSIKMLKELLLSPNYTTQTLNKIKTRILSSINQKKSDFDYIAKNNLKSILFKDTPLQYPAIGTEDSIKDINIDNIKNFINNHLNIHNAIVVIGGKFDTNDTKKDLESLLSILNGQKSKELEKIDINTKVEEKITYEETQQAYIYFGSAYNVSVKDEDFYKSRVANFILGSSGFGSRLMEEIRVKRGLAYSAYSKANVNNTNSYFSGYLQTKLESQKEAIKIVQEEIEKFVKKGVTQKELDSAKKFLLGSEPLRNETMSQRISRTFFEFYKGVEIGQGQKDLKNIENLKLDELNQFIKQHDEIMNLTFSIVTNQK